MAYLGQGLDSLDTGAVEVGGEALELLGAVHVLGRRLEALDGVLHGRVGGALLELDDVGARDGGSGQGLDQGSRERQREDRGQGEEVMHFEGG